MRFGSPLRSDSQEPGAAAPGRGDVCAGQREREDRAGRPRQRHEGQDHRHHWSVADPACDLPCHHPIPSLSLPATAHRLSTIRNSTCIYVIDKVEPWLSSLSQSAQLSVCSAWLVRQGTIIEQGTHDELIARKGTYAKLVEAQERGGTVCVSRFSLV